MGKLLGLCLFILLFSPTVDAKWKAFETPNYTFYFKEDLTEQTDSFLHYLETYRQPVTELTGISPKKYPILIEDIGMLSNGVVYSFPKRMRLSANIPGSQSFPQTIDFYRTLAIHEHTHAAHLSNASWQNSTMYKLFGEFFLPNDYSPRWLSEGIAVYMESSLSPYEGRLNDGYFDAVIASKAKEDELAELAELNAPFRVYPEFNAWYLYGGKFIEYLKNNYPEDTLKDFILENAEHGIPFVDIIAPQYGFDRSFRKVYKKSVQTVYKEWVAEERRRAGSYKIRGDRITSSHWYKDHLSVYNQKLFFTQTVVTEPEPLNFKHITSLQEYDPQTKRTRTVLTSLQALEAPPQFTSEAIYYLKETVSKGYSNITFRGFGIQRGLYRYDRREKKEKQLIKGNIRSFAVLGVDQFFYGTSPIGRYQTTIFKYENGEKQSISELNLLVSEMVYIDEKLFLIAKTKETTWDLYELNPKTNKVVKLLSTPFSITRLAKAGDKLTFTANFYRKYASYEYDPKKQKVKKLTQASYAVSGVKLGPVTYFVSLDSKGEDIYESARELDFVVPKQILTLENKQANTITKNVLTNPVKTAQRGLVQPYSKVFPFLLAGQDEIGMIDYSLNYFIGSGFTASVESRHFSPLVVGYAYVDEDSFLTADYPLYASIGSGIQRVHTTFRTNFDRDVLPGIQVIANTPEWELNSKTEIDLYDGGGYTQKNTIKRLFTHSSIQANTLSHSEVKSGFPVRGYSFFTRRTGFSYSLEYIHKLKTLNKAFWTPSIGFGNLYGSLFYDHVKNKDQLYSYGYEVLFETGIGMGAQFITGAGFAQSKETQSLFMRFGVTVHN